jgi:hypothetical protein
VRKDTQKKSKDMVGTDTSALDKSEEGKDFVMKQPIMKELSIDGDDKVKNICHNYMPMQ